MSDCEGCKTLTETLRRCSERADRAERSLRLLREAVSLVLTADPDKTEALRKATTEERR